MQFVPEEIIDAVLDELGASQELQAETLERLRDEQPVVLAYLFTEHVNAFLQQEKEYLLYLLLVLWESSKRVNPSLPTATEEALSQAEEANWETLQEGSSKRFRDRLDVFFATTPQEDLLAFVEDSLLDEEDGFVSKEGREPMFVMLKSILDCWDES